MTFDLDVQNKTGIQFVNSFDSIPEDTTILNISHNNLGLKPVYNLVEGFKKIPAKVKTLALAENQLNKKSSTELRQIMEALPTTITELYLCRNALGELSTDDLIHLCSAIPLHIKFLSLFGNRMNLKTCAELIKIYRALPANVTSLYLGECVPCRHTPNQLTDIIKAIPITIEKVTIDKIEFNLSNLHKITNEIARMENAKWRKGSFLVNIGILKSSDDKIKALLKLKTLLIHRMDQRINSEECIEELRKWRDTNWTCISKQRNCVHSFFVPYHMPTSAKLVDEIFEEMGITDKEPIFTPFKSEFCGL